MFGRQRQPTVLRSAFTGALAGAAGRTALNAVTYLDMTMRGRPESNTPKQTVESLTDGAGVDLPGSDETEQHRASALGALLGIATGVGVGAAYGVARGLGLRLPLPGAAVALAAGGFVASNVPMTALGVTDPRRWTAADWASDVLPHLYGALTALVLEAAA